MKDKQLVERFVSELKDAVKADLNKLDWLTEKTKESLAIKSRKFELIISRLTLDLVTNLVQEVGFQSNDPNQGDPQDVDKHYANLLVTDNHFDNSIAFMKFWQSSFWNTYSKSYNFTKIIPPADDWLEGWATSPEPFILHSDTIAIGAASMQMPIFSVDIPEYVTYAAWGSPVASAIIAETGVFDTGGGNYTQKFSSSTLERFERKKKCFFDQYSAIYLDGENKTELEEGAPWSNSIIFQGMADYKGLNITYRAWKAHSSATQHNSQLPGLEQFTNDQLFFINFANTRCTKTRASARMQ